MPEILEDAENGLSVRMRSLLHRLRQRRLVLDTEINEVTRLLTNHADESPMCQRAVTVPGIGPIVSTALVTAVGKAQAFRRGRDMAAWLGLVPRQYSTGGKATLGRISKRGNIYLRSLFIQDAQALYIHMKRDRSRLSVSGFEISKRIVIATWQPSRGRTKSCGFGLAYFLICVGLLNASSLDVCPGSLAGGHQAAAFDRLHHCDLDCTACRDTFCVARPSTITVRCNPDSFRRIRGLGGFIRN